MITIEKTQVLGLEHALRGMRNPMNSWDKSDSAPWGEYARQHEIKRRCEGCDHNPEAEKYFVVGEADHDLMLRLAKQGPVHAKFRRMIIVYVGITAPLYWWKEFDTYKVGTVANSCSTMHKIHAKEFALEDFSHEHLMIDEPVPTRVYSPLGMLQETIKNLNHFRSLLIETGDKKYWWQMIQLLPSSYNQRRTVMLNYEVLANMYRCRREHKLDEWREFCGWIEELPYSEIITCNGEREET